MYFQYYSGCELSVLQIKNFWVGKFKPRYFSL